SGRGVLEPHRLLRPRQAVWCFCSRSTPFTLAVALTFVRTLSGERRIRGSRSMRFAGTHGFNLAGGRRVVTEKAHSIARQEDGARRPARCSASRRGNYLRASSRTLSLVAAAEASLRCHSATNRT